MKAQDSGRARCGSRKLMSATAGKGSEDHDLEESSATLRSSTEEPRAERSRETDCRAANVGKAAHAITNLHEKRCSRAVKISCPER